MPPHPRLPPLPPLNAWNTYFPRKYLPRSASHLTREFPRRRLLARRSLCDEFVRALGIRPGEVIIDVHPGSGLLTRSLLAGGKREEVGSWTREEIRDVKEGVLATMGINKEDASRAQTIEAFPNWEKELLQMSQTETPQISDSPKASDAEPNINLAAIEPSLVVVSEPSAELLVRGLGFSPANVSYHPKYATPAGLPPPSSPSAPQPDILVQSAHHPRLILSHSDAYRWSVLTKILADPLVSPHLPVFDPEKPPGAKTTKRPWSADPPPITVVAQMPDSLVGEQLVAQWIGSVVGEQEQRSWIWEWGRMRLALLIGPGLYDRLTARPGEKVNCKLSVMTSALFDISPLPPYHHLDSFVKKSSKLPPPSDTPLPRTATFADDFWPPPFGRHISPIQQLPRPEMLGIMLEPKKDSPVTLQTKDDWDYVLRKCFVRESGPLRDGLKSLGFNGEILADRVMEIGPRFKGPPVDVGKVVRDLEVEEWARVVDVFHKWAFKPENLILDSRVNENFSREVGQD